MTVPQPHQRRTQLPFVPLAAAALAWVVSDQLGSSLSQARCGLASPLTIGLIGLAGLLCCAAGAAVALRVWRVPSAHSGGRRFVALLGGLLSAVLAIAIIFQTVSSFIIPRCFA